MLVIDSFSYPSLSMYKKSVLLMKVICLEHETKQIMTKLSFMIKRFLNEKIPRKHTLFLHYSCQPAHTRYSTSSQLCIDVIQIEQVSTAQVTHTFTLLDYIKTHYINTALAIR